VYPYATVRAAPVAAEREAHPASWWAQFPEASGQFDAALVTEGISDLVIPKITAPLLRREAELAADVMVRHLEKPANPELAERAGKQLERLLSTVERLAERATGDDAGIAETYVVCQALRGSWAEAAVQAEPLVGTQPLLKAFVGALRLERFNTSLTVQLLRAGRPPAIAVEVGLIVGKYSWWPGWLLKTVTDRALDGRIDAETIQALDRCAYAELSPGQSRMARRLLAGDEAAIEASARQLESAGEHSAAANLREGDLTSVALAARLIPR